MANRITTHILKNSDVISRPLPSTLFKGEAIVNTADGIMFFSGSTSSTSGWTQSGPSTPTFWEVGSNLYDLKIRNKIQSYSGLTNLSGLFLSGTTNGFVLAPISAIVGVDTYVSGFTYSNNIATIKRNLGLPDLSIVINTMTGLTVNGTLSATTGNFGSILATTITGTTLYGNGANITGLAFLTGGTANNAAKTYTFTNSTGGTFVVNALTDIYVTGLSYSNNVITGTNNTGGTISTVINTMTGLTVNGNVNITGTLSATTYLNLPIDVRVTGGTYSAGTTTFNNNTGGTFTVTGFTSTDTYVSGLTYSNNIVTIKQTQGQSDLIAQINTMTGLTVNGILSATTGNFNSLNSNNLSATTVSGINSLSANSITATTLAVGSITSYSGLTNLSNQFLSGTTNGFVLAPISAITGVDTYDTGFTYNPASNTLTIKRNLGQPDLTAQINSVSGFSVANLATNRLVYTTTGGTLTTGTAIFDGINTTLPTNGSLIVGTGGLTIGSGGSPSVAGTGDLIVNGNLTVFGGSVSAFTTNLYVEDNNIGLNYNPTGSTIATSIGAGLTIQDGNGIVGGDINLNINRLDTLTGLTAGNTPSVSEYTAATGYANRGWITQLNDIVIRSTNLNTPNGVRVLAEFDILDSGSY